MIFIDGLLNALFLLLKILAAIFVFGIIIFVHELGHFVMAKLMGVKVNEFALGMGPRLLKFGKGETVYSLRALPIGGFCAMEGEDDAGAGSVSLPGGKAEGLPPVDEALPAPESAPPPAPDPRAFPNKKVWRRVLITIAGAAMNLVLGFVLLLGYFGFCNLPDENGKVFFSSTKVAQLAENAKSYETGLRVGDEIVRIDGKTIFTDRDVAMIMQSSENGVFDIVVKREVEGKIRKVTLTGVTFPLRQDENGNRYLEYEFKVQGIPQTLGSTIAQAAKMECTVGIMIWRTLGDIVPGKYGLNDLSGPVGTVDAIGDAVGNAVQAEHWQIGLGNILMLVTLITVNVGIFNLLPLPALDGGRLIFLIIEGVTRHKVPAKYEGWIHAVGFLLLLLLMVFVTFGDIARIFGG